MDWTMILKDDFGVNGWTRRAGNHHPLILLLLFLLSLGSIQVRSDIEFPRDQHFSWKTGQWGQCIGEECGSGGIQTRTVWCVHTDGWTTHHSHCQHAGKPESQRHCFRVCEWHQNLFEWDVSDWGACVLIPFFSNELKLRTTAGECVTAQHGIQRRRVRCARTSNGTVVATRICEFFSQRPATEQACLIPCPQDCVVSDFTSWSGCSRTCGAGLQHRTRHVLATPMYGGSACPNLTQIRTCSTLHADCPAGEGEYRYSLKVGPWSECRLPHRKGVLPGGRTTVNFSNGTEENNTVKRHAPQQHTSHHHHSHHHHHHHTHTNHMSWELEVGYQTRQVRCTRNDGKNAMLSLCVQEDNTPLTFQACVMPKDCQVSDWSSWSLCSKTCRGRATDLSPGYRVRTRTMTHVAVGDGGRQCPALEEKEACNILGDLLPLCPRYVWRTTDWAGCRVAPLLGQQDRRLANTSALCGGGVQTRETYCVQLHGDSTAPRHRKEVARPVSTRLCAGEELPSAAQHCFIPCPQDCLLSPWSPWGACLHHNCHDELQGRKGFRQRRRQVLWEPGDHRASCPHLVESIPCEDPACYVWRIQPGERCVPADGACGPGTAARNVTCIDLEAGEEVPSDQCVEDPPPAVVACEVACPGGCVVGSWSPWSSCSHTCATKSAEGRQSRTRFVLALPGQGGKECPAATALEEWRPCNEHPCMVFYWEASSWGPCVQDASSVHLNGSDGGSWNATADACAVGVQTRQATCVKMNAGAVISKRCPDSARPETLRPCLLPCKRDCIVTPFSEWTACPSSCVPDNTTAITQSRYRTITQRSSHGGQECPDTLYEERECESLPLCPVYSWKVHKWHSCTLVPDTVRQGLAGTAESCGNGLETRGLSCVGESAELSDMTACLRWAGAVPPQIRKCRVACRDDCTLTGWSKFSDCVGGCGSSRARKRSLTGRSKKKERCLNEELHPLVETEACPCLDEFLSQPYGNWSSCILAEPPAAPGSLQGWRSLQREVKECGPGLRYKAVACVDQQGHLVSPALCTDSGYLVEPCHLACPLDCKLSVWSAWSSCSASCGSGLKTRSKWLREKAFNGGRPCPKLDLKNQVYEAVPCHNACSQYEWRTEPWSMCTINSVDETPACGEGVQSRKIRCVRRGEESAEGAASVDDSLCDQDDAMPPIRARVCFLPCPEDCVMSPWGPWSQCPQQCDDPAAGRNRTRRVLRLPSSEERACPEDAESEACLLNSTCFTYQYRLSDWSTCQLSEKAVCGQGSRSRLLDCVRSDDKVLELSMCEQSGAVNKWNLSEDCVVDCPVSCLLSQWSPWAECSHTCGNQGHTERSRSVLQQAHEEGRPCPSQLTQTKPCPIQPCYTWLLGDWSPCAVEGAECGEGLRRRSLSCVAHWGDWPDTAVLKLVEDELCGDRLSRQSQQELERPCFVPCPGDCHLTEWSSWSSCQLTCLEGRSFESTGRQARSRAVVIQVLENQDGCPQQVFETQPCKGGKCHSYQWRTGGWTDNERVVWCQRSDGVNVTGGCFPQNRPTTVRHCLPPCTKPFSHCTPNGVCGCEKGYTEVMTTHGFLDYCTRTPGADNKKADVKTNSGRLRPRPPPAQDYFSEWSLRPVGPDGRLKLWVYAVTAVGFILILFIIALSFLVCKPPKTSKMSTPPQKPLTLAYDGDADM